jgi:hypothetical protein
MSCPKSITGNNDMKDLLALLSYCSEYHRVLENEILLSKKSFVIGTGKSHRAKSVEYGRSTEVLVLVF